LPAKQPYGEKQPSVKHSIPLGRSGHAGANDGDDEESGAFIAPLETPRRRRPAPDAAVDAADFDSWPSSAETGDARDTPAFPVDAVLARHLTELFRGRGLLSERVFVRVERDQRRSSHAGDGTADDSATPVANAHQKRLWHRRSQAVIDRAENMPIFVVTVTPANLRRAAAWILAALTLMSAGAWIGK
jgi:hypothetical protein